MSQEILVHRENTSTRYWMTRVTNSDIPATESALVTERDPITVQVQVSRRSCRCGWPTSSGRRPSATSGYHVSIRVGLTVAQDFGAVSRGDVSDTEGGTAKLAVPDMG